MNTSEQKYMRGMQKGLLCALWLLCLTAWSASTQAAKSDKEKSVLDYVMNIERSSLAVVDSNVVVSIQITAIQDVPRTQSVVLAPVLVDTVSTRQAELPMIFINSRNQQIFFERNLKYEYPDAQTYRKKRGQNLNIDYVRTLKYETWMDHAVLKLRKQSCACSNMKSRGELLLASFNTEEPVLEIKLYPVYIVPPADNSVKVREERGSALLCFELNKWEIKPEYMTNPTELQKIHNSVNLVRNDSDVTIRQMTIEGYASPEGTEKHNLMLSERRTEALKKYLEVSKITRGIKMEADGRGENWSGLIKQLKENKSIPQRDKLLSIANRQLTPDEKERQMRRSAPEGYAYILKHIYPGLRCTNYTVIYTVRPFTLEESERVFETRPINLNLNEIYRLAEKYKNDKAKYNSIIRKASMLYPNDSYINLTMACLALKRADTEEAEEYLSKVNESPEKTMNMGLLSYLKGDLPTAVRLVTQARDMGVLQAEEQLKEFEKLNKSKKK